MRFFKIKILFFIVTALGYLEAMPEGAYPPLYAPPQILVEENEMNDVVCEFARSWQGAAPGIARTRNGRLFACLFSGGKDEPDVRNYAIYMLSDNEGKSWIDPFAIVNHPDKNTRIMDPSLWVDSNNRLWMRWNHHYPVKGYTKNRFGAWSICIENPDAPLDELRAQIAKAKPVRDFDGVRINKPIILSTGEWLQPVSHVMRRAFHAFVSDDMGKSWVLRGAIINPEGAIEPMTVEKTDGTLWSLVRLGDTRTRKEDGGVGQTFSPDKGKTWSSVQSRLPKPLIGAHSRLYFGRLQSGALIYVTNATQKFRRDLTVYLSEDDGKTWPYSLLIDGREGLGTRYSPFKSLYMSGPSYPDLIQAPDGRIFLVWDFGRYHEKEMRMSIFTEADIKAGKFNSPAARDKMVVSRLSSYLDIREVETALPKFVDFNPSKSLAENLSVLPQKIKITDEKGEAHTLSGKWTVKVPGAKYPEQYEAFNPSAPKDAILDFEQNPPITHLDTFLQLRCKLKVK